MGNRRRGGVAVMDVALAAVRGTVGIGQVLAEQLIGRRPQEQMGAEVAVQQRDHVAAGPQGHRPRRWPWPRCRRSMVTVPLT